MSSLFELYPNTSLYLVQEAQTDLVEVDDIERFIFRVQGLTEAGRKTEIGLVFMSLDNLKAFSDGLLQQIEQIEREVNVGPNPEANDVSHSETSESAE